MSTTDEVRAAASRGVKAAVGRWRDALRQDLRSAVRPLRQSPGFSSVVILVLAVGVGASTAFFATLNDVLWRPPPGMAKTDGLFVLSRTDGTKQDGFTHIGFRAYQAQLQSFSTLVAHRGADVVLREGGPPVRLKAALVTQDFFATLGLPIAPGRDFVAAEHQTPGTHPVVIVSHRLWQARFRGDPELIGRTLWLAGTGFTVVGIAPPGFGSLELDLGDPPDLWLPLMMEGQLRVEFPVLNRDFFTSLTAIGRLRPGATQRQAEAELAAVAPRIEKPDTATGRTKQVVLAPRLWCWRDHDRAEAYRILTPLNALAVLVLAIGGANFSNLLLARATTRRKEFAVRLALGATRARLIRHLMGESMLLALAAAPLALGLGWLLERWLWHMIGLPVQAQVDGRVVAFAVGLAGAMATGCALVPAWQVTRGDLTLDLKTGAGTATRSRSHLQTALLAGQIAAALVALYLAALFIHTVRQLTTIDLGFPTENLLLVRPDLAAAEYPDERVRQFQRELTARFAALPLVRSATRAAELPRGGNLFWGTRHVVPDGAAAAANQAGVTAEFNEVASGYFATLEVPLHRGRDFDPRDAAGKPAVAIVNESLAAQLWSGADPIGRRVRFSNVMFSPVYEVIGIVPNLRVFFREERPPPQIYLALDQCGTTRSTLLVRVAADVPAFAHAARECVRALDGTLPPPAIADIRSHLAAAHDGERMYAIFSSALGGAALALAAFGLASMLAYGVAQRTKEIGIRMALGAEHSAVIALVVRDGMKVVLAGAAGGAMVGAAASRLIANRLYGVNAFDPISAAASLALVLTVALPACWLPARRAARIDPLVALRTE